MSNYFTDAYARIQCKECGNKLVDILKPGTSFDSIKPCPCESKQVVDYTDTDIEELRELLRGKDIPFSPQAGKPTLIKKLKGA